MGAHTFEDTFMFNGNPVDAQTAYTYLCDSARDEYGSSAYNGTISTTHGFFHATPQLMTVAEAYKFVNDNLDNTQKRGPCGAIPLREEIPAVREPATRHKVTITLPAELSQDRDAIDKAVAKQLGVKPADLLDRWTGIARSHADTRVETTATTGPTETRFFLIVDGWCGFEWDKGYSSQAEARAAIRDLAPKKLNHGHPVSVEVVSMTRRATGEALVTATITPKKITTTYDVTVSKIIKPAKTTNKQSGWMFFGRAAS